MHILLFSLFLVIATFGMIPNIAAHQVSVHDLITKVAIEKSTNLQSFLDDFGIHTTVLPFTDYSSYTSSSLYGENKGRGYSTIPADLIRLGSVMEDLGKRPVQHFYRPTSLAAGSALESVIPIIPAPSDARSWAFDAGVEGWVDTVPFVVSFHLFQRGPNIFSYPVAYDEYYEALTSTLKAGREAAFTRMFYALGHVIHLVQDMSQPSHVRNAGIRSRLELE